MRKWISWFMAAMTVLSFCGAGASGLAGTYDVEIWVDDSIIELTEAQIEEFNRTNTDGIIINANIIGVSEGDAASMILTDVEAGGDLYCFAQDQAARLIQAGALSRLDSGSAEAVIRGNDASSVAAATLGDALYAYPLTSDNGYFMYYDKSVIPEADVDSLEKLIADCEAAQKSFAFEIKGSGWYMASFFFATGCVSEWSTDDEGAFIAVHDTFNTPEGLTAVRGMKKLMDSPCFMDSSDYSAFDRGAAVLVSGTWNYYALKEKLGDRLGVTDLPSFEVDGRRYHLSSFSGNKLMGVKPQTHAGRAAALHKLAQYLSGEQAQMERYEAKNWGPSNRADQASEAVQSDPVLAALLKQGEYAVPQGQIHGAWWSIATSIAEELQAADDEAGLQDALKHYEDRISDLFSLDPDALLFAGAWNGWDNADVSGEYYLKDGSVTLYVPESDYMGGRIVHPGSWDTDKGYDQVISGREYLLGTDDDNNIVFAEPGLYTVTWDGTWITITSVKIIRLPAGLTRIESGAFAGIQGATFVMNDNVTYIAPDAFDPSVRISAKKGSYAYNRCVELGLSVEEK